MKTDQKTPSFDDKFPPLNQFILELMDTYNAGKINSWDDLEKLVNAFFTPARMEQMESVLPGWSKMASYANGRTLVHVMCVFLGLYRMPEFLNLIPQQQQLMKWAILFHDLEKEVRNGKRDHCHAFRSAVAAAKLLPKLGFPTNPEYNSLINAWSEFTLSAITKLDDSSDDVQDNRRIPGILDGIEHMFGHNTPGALIIKTILFHLSVDMIEWPPAAPLSNGEMISYFDKELLPLLKLMHLGDTDGWALFEPDARERMRIDTITIFENLDKIILQ